jgi:hypothetical protein
MLDFIAKCQNAIVCQFDKTPTLGILMFELLIIAGVAAVFLILPKLQSKIGWRFLIMAIAILIFELFTAPMWQNLKMGWWAYIYRDVSWILTLGWTSLILSIVVFVDHFAKSLHLWKRFFIYMACLMVSVSFLEIIVVNLGIRRYSPEVLESSIGVFLWGVPVIDVLYYTPVFTGLVIGFYQYWCFVLDRVPLIPLKTRKWWRSLAIAFLGIFLFEVMIEPVVKNQKLPEWSYIFHDISIIMTGLWIIIVWLSVNIVEKLFLHYSIVVRFLLTLLLTGAFALPIESWFILNGYRVYGPSAVNSFTGFVASITQVPVEVAFAIPCYMALVIGFIRYWEIILDNQL